ncbi:MAG TPA: LssY C-terminal domain-containing protein [Verrucomicrobiae bacterium]|nr:LssY C-terminal domain-containing protein [Verrucomicrobiae bacterium]
MSFKIAARFLAAVFAAGTLACGGVAHAQSSAPANPSATTPAATAAAAPGTPAVAGKTYTFTVNGTDQWIDTKLDLHAGAEIQITGTGSITYPAHEKQPEQDFGPAGLARGWKDLIHQYPVADGGHGELVGRLGPADYAQPFAIGESLQYSAPVAGRLYLGVNQGMKEAASATGSFTVKISVTNAGLDTSIAATAGGPPDTPLPSITQALLAEIPRRVTDPQGKPGDMVNVLLIGTQDQVLKTFAAAGWVQVDRSVSDTILTGLVDSLEKKDYLTMPMSTLFLFNRPQDYGFAHAEPVKVVMSRNHLRVWKSPYEVNGVPVWCIAATHDIGFERDQRNNGLTHKIDPAVDGEREFVNDTLSSTGLVAQRDHVTPRDALTTAKTATGGEFHSDGRVVVLVLRDAAATMASAK